MIFLQLNLYLIRLYMSQMEHVTTITLTLPLVEQYPRQAIDDFVRVLFQMSPRHVLLVLRAQHVHKTCTATLQACS